MFPGFIPGSRATLIFDLLIVALILISGLMIWSVKAARSGDFKKHKQLQIIIVVLLAVAVIVFEVDMRVFGWEHLAKSSAFFDSIVYPSLYIHIAFSTAAVLSWTVQLIRARKNIDPDMKRSASYGASHRFWGKISFALLFGTAATGGVFYILAFMA